MTFFTSLDYALALAVALLALRSLRRFASLRTFELGLLVLNAVFLTALAEFNWISEAVMFLTAAGVYILARFRLRWAGLAGVFLVLSVFGAAKYRGLTELTGLDIVLRRCTELLRVDHPLAFVGISYFTFKVIHFVVDLRQGGIRRPTFLRYLNFVFFFPAFMSGPIDRYENFSDSTESAYLDRPLRASRFEILARFAVGLFKKQVLAHAISVYAVGLLDAEGLHQRAGWELVLGIYAYTFFIYFDFSGYSDMAIASAQALGFDLPENFKSPFISRSIQEYWTRWHISLSEWIRDYLFFPSQRVLLERFPEAPDYVIPVSAIVFAFTLCGLWHGDQLHFVLWGLGQGVGLGTYMIYSGLMKKRFRKDYKRLRERVWYRWSAVALTLTFVAFDNVLFAENGFEVLKSLLAKWVSE